MNGEVLAKAAVVLAGHGSSTNPSSGEPILVQTEGLRRRGCFAEVRPGFWKQEPFVVRVVAELRQPGVFVVPFFISDGYFSEAVIPRALGFARTAEHTLERVLRRGDQTLFYCEPVGTHPGMTALLLASAREVLEQNPLPNSPAPAEISLFIAGHGTEQHQNSRKAVARQAELIRQRGQYAQVEAVFLEEAPRITDCCRIARTPYVVVVPFFISEGLHVAQDIPVLLGQPIAAVKERLEAGQAGWPNPTPCEGKLLWYARSVGGAPSLGDIVLARVREAAAWNT